MAWTAPANWTVNEIVTAAKMNAHVRDNLRYLKGLDGAVTIEAAATITASDSATSRTALNTAEAVIANTNNTAGSHYSALRFKANDTGAGGTVYSSGRILSEFQAATFGDASLIFQTPTASDTFQDVMTIRGTKVGIGTLAPQGKIHTYDAISGLIKWEYDGLDGTARTVIPDGAGDVIYGLVYFALIRGSGGTIVPATNSAGTALAPGNNQNITVGADTVQIQCAANGSVTVQRTAGTQTHKVSLICQWL